MEVNFSIKYLKIVEKQVTTIPLNMRNIIKNAIEERLTTNPLEFGKPLRYAWKGHRRLRVGDYRIIYRIEYNSNIVIIVAIEHRKDAY